MCVCVCVCVRACVRVCVCVCVCVCEGEDAITVVSDAAQYFIVSCRATMKC